MLDLNNKPEKPLVTFALFAYNQEKYIREAVEGAFAQTYEPLEIILSDDCSSDRTFQIMKEMSSSYDGPHKIILRHNYSNQGIGKHVEKVMSLARGQIIVLAAGDDISSRCRTKVVYEKFCRNKNAYAFVSAVRNIESDTIEYVMPPNTIHSLLSRQRYIVGATAAYKRELIDSFPDFIDSLKHEDDVLALRALILGKIISSEEALVCYRSESGVSAETRKDKPKLVYYRRNKEEILERLCLCHQWIKDLKSKNMSNHICELRKYRSFYLLLLSLQREKSIKKNIFVITLKELGIKEVFYHFLGYKTPKLLRILRYINALAR